MKGRFMRHNKRNIILLAIIAGAVLMLALTFGRGGGTLASGRQDVSNDNDAPVLEYRQAGPAEARKVKKVGALRDDKPITEFPGNIEPLPLAAHFWIGLPVLPVAQSDAVVLGEVIDRSASLTEDRTGVYSEFSVLLDTVFKDAQGLLGPGGLVQASRPGGAVRFASGKVQRYTISKLGYPRQGGTYVLFLKRDEQGDFSVLTGYELRNNKVVPLDGDNVDPRGDLQFRVYRGARPDAFLAELKRAVQAAPGGRDQ